MASKRSIKRDLFFSVISCIIGVLLIVVSLLDVLPENVYGSVLFSIGFGLVVNSIHIGMRRHKMLNDPDMFEEYDILENDERYIALTSKASNKVLWIFVYLELFIGLVAAVFGYKVIWCIINILCLGKLILWGFAYKYYCEKY